MGRTLASTYCADLSIQAFCTASAPLPASPSLVLLSMERPAQGQTELMKSISPCSRSGYSGTPSLSRMCQGAPRPPQCPTRCDSLLAKGE